MKTNTGTELLKLIRENPDLEIVPMVDCEVVAEDFGYWLGHWGSCKVTEYYSGLEYIHFKDDDAEDVLNDMVGCKYGCDKDGRDIYDDLSEEEWDEIFNSLPWVKCIAVYITT